MKLKLAVLIIYGLGLAIPVTVGAAMFGASNDQQTDSGRA